MARPILSMLASRRTLRLFFEMMIITISIAGCSRALWTKPGFTTEQWKHDTYECERDIRQTYSSFGSDLTGLINARRFHERCLEAKGYVRVRPDRAASAPPQADDAWVDCFGTSDSEQQFEKCMNDNR
jgi:hypothetical protein